MSWEGHQHAEFEMKEASSFFECRLIDALNMIAGMRVEKKALNEGVYAEGSTSFGRDREAKVEAPKSHMFKVIHDAQEVENFLWHLENYFKCSQVKSDKNKIDIVVLYL